MKKIIIATAALAMMCGSAFAQGTTGPAAQSGDNMQKPGMTNTTGNGSMEKDSMTKSTTGMNKDGMAKDGMMKQPDASGQGGSGAGSDQGGTMTKTK
jgi:pentapeptide MXKDX repeat protein